MHRRGQGIAEAVLYNFKRAKKMVVERNNAGCTVGVPVVRGVGGMLTGGWARNGGTILSKTRRARAARCCF